MKQKLHNMELVGFRFSGLTFVLLLVALFFVFDDGHAQSPYKSAREGNQHYKDEEYSDAELKFLRSLEKKPDFGPSVFNLGNSLYRQMKFEEAAKAFENSLEAAGNEPSRASHSWYNLGNSYFKEGKYRESIEAYKSALRLNPADNDARHNLQLANLMLQQEKEQDKQENQDKGQDEKEQDQKEKDKQEQEGQDGEGEDQQNEQQQQKQEENDQEEQQKTQPAESREISSEDTERLLQQIMQNEKEVIEKLQEQRARVKPVPVEKNW